MEVDTYDWITFLPMADGSGAYNRYFGRLTTGKMKIRGVMARKGDTPEYVNKMPQEVFEVLAWARSRGILRRARPEAVQVLIEVSGRAGERRHEEACYHRRVSRMNYSHRCAEGSAVSKRTKTAAPGTRDGIGYVVKDAEKWAVDPKEMPQISMEFIIGSFSIRLGQKLHIVSDKTPYSPDVRLIHLEGHNSGGSYLRA
jgi:DNA polymerase I